MSNRFNTMRNVLLLLAIAVWLPACSYIPWSSSEKEVEIKIREPTELSDFLPEVRIEEKWKISVGGDAGEKYIRLQPYVYEDKIAFVQTGGKVSVHDINNGRSIWANQTADSISAGVGGNTETLVVGTLDGAVFAMHSGDGSEAWSVSVGSEVISVALASGELVILRTNDNRIMGLAVATGERLWTVTQTSPALTLRGGGLPLVRDGIVYAGMDNGKVIAISMEAGNVLWESRVSVPSGRSELERLVDVDGQMAADENYIYAASYHGRVVAIDRANGRVVWARDLASITGVAVDESLVYVTDRDDNVWGLEKSTGVSSWKQDKLLYRELSAPVLQGDTVLVGDYKGYLHALSKQDGRIVGRTNLGKKPIHTSPESTSSVSYVVDMSGHLAAYTVISVH